jgi:hypothetical protein
MISGGAADLRSHRCLPFLLSVLIAVSVGLTSCREHRANPETRLTEPYAPVAGAVGLDLLPLHSEEGSRDWLASYTDERGTTKFRIELGPAATSDDKSSPASSGKGRFLAEAGSDPIPLLDSLKKALEAKHMPTNIRKTEALTFDYVSLGENQTRLADGSFGGKPKGDWTAMKIFLGQGKNAGEVFLNFNGVAHQAEFSIKDPEYGDIVIEQLAKVL